MDDGAPPRLEPIKQFVSRPMVREDDGSTRDMTAAEAAELERASNEWFLKNAKPAFRVAEFAFYGGGYFPEKYDVFRDRQLVGHVHFESGVLAVFGGNEYGNAAATFAANGYERENWFRNDEDRRSYLGRAVEVFRELAERELVGND